MTPGNQGCIKKFEIFIASGLHVSKEYVHLQPLYKQRSLLITGVNKKHRKVFAGLQKHCNFALPFLMKEHAL